MEGKTIMKKYFLVLFSIMMLSLVSCDSTEVERANSEAVISFTDDLGREVQVQNPQRVATLLGSFADVWYLAGGTICAAPDDAWNDFDLPLPKDAVNLGNTKSPSLEKLFAANPDFIIASTNTRLNMEWKETLEDSGIPVAYFDVANLEDYLRMLKICTDITGRTDLYEKNGVVVQEKCREVIARCKEGLARQGEMPKVLSLRASSASVRAKNSQGNVLGEMLNTLGCINIADDDATLLENLSMEKILEENPDFIFFVQQGDDREAVEKHIETFIAENPAWHNLTAVKEGRVYHMEKSLFSMKPNDNWAEAYEKLEGILTNE